MINSRLSRFARISTGLLLTGVLLNGACSNLQDEAALHKLLQLLAKEGLLTSAFDLSDGGLAVALGGAYRQLVDARTRHR